MSEWLALILGSFKEGLIAFAMRRPRLLRILVDWARCRKRLLRLGEYTFVAKADDVREVLTRDDDFLVGPINQTKVLTGDFLFSLDPSPKYREEKDLIRKALPGNRIAKLERITDRAARDVLAAKAVKSQFDAVDFAERVTVRIAKSFWGLDPAGAQSRVVRADEGEDTMVLWLRKLAAVISSGEPAPFGLIEAGRACRDEYMHFVQAACEARAKRNKPGYDVIGRLVKLASPEVAQRNVAGIIVTAAAVVTKAFAHALEQLLLDADARARARAAAQAGRRAEVAQLLVEALRFNPVFPMLTRYCPRNTTLAKGTARESEIPAGSTVVVGLIGALFDPKAVREPGRFVYGRALELNPGWSTAGGRYGGPANSGPGADLLFGGGTHRCIGDQMALAELAAMGMAVLKLPEPLIVGPLRYDGPAVKSLVVEFG